jgi:hypothetical protein
MPPQTAEDTIARCPGLSLTGLESLHHKEAYMKYCPFCDGTSVMKSAWKFFRWFWVECTLCKAKSGEYRTAKAAEAAWDKRVK